MRHEYLDHPLTQAIRDSQAGVDDKLRGLAAKYAIAVATALAATGVASTVGEYAVAAACAGAAAACALAAAVRASPLLSSRAKIQRVRWVAENYFGEDNSVKLPWRDRLNPPIKFRPLQYAGVSQADIDAEADALPSVDKTLRLLARRAAELART